MKAIKISTGNFVRHSLTYVKLIAIVVLVSASPAEAASPRQVLEEVQPKTVKLYGAGGLRNLASYGTGFFISPEGHILTVWNHLLDTDRVVAVLDDGRRLPTEFVSGAGEAGLAVLKVDLRGNPHFDLTKTKQASAGTPVIGFSNMFNVAAGDEPVSAIHGVISTVTPLTARRGRFEIPFKDDVYIVDAVMNNPGAAGGVLTTLDGELLGIIGKQLRDSRSNLWINYAIPLSGLRETVQQLVRGGMVSENQVDRPPVIRPIDTSPLGFRLVPNVVSRTPAYVDHVEAGSEADESGLREDDLVVLVNDELIQSCNEFYEELQQMRKGDELRMTVRRNQQLISLELIVPELP